MANFFGSALLLNMDWPRINFLLEEYSGYIYPPTDPSPQPDG